MAAGLSISHGAGGDAAGTRGAATTHTEAQVGRELMEQTERPCEYGKFSFPPHAIERYYNFRQVGSSSTSI